MSRSLTREEAAALDRTAMTEYGIAGIALMENAGAAVARAVLHTFKEKAARHVAVVCGRGNNGGDGFVAARHLISYGVPTSVFLLCREEDIRRPSDAAANLDILQQMVRRGFAAELIEIPRSEELQKLSSAVDSATVMVDAILGTGLSGPVREPAASAIDVINSSDAFVVAVDIPSGLDCNEGVPLGKAVRADLTVTFVSRKAGFDKPGTREYLGELIVAEIGCGFLLKG